MDELGLGVRGGAIADIRPPRLEVAAVGAGADLQPFLAAGRPDINVIRLGGGKTEVAGAELADTVGQTQSLADILSVAGKLFQLVIGSFRRNEFIKLHLIELVAALDTAGILAGGHLLAAEAGGVSDVVQRQGFFGENFITMEGGEGYLGGAHEPEVVFDVMIDIFGELGQLSGAYHAFLFDHIRRVYLFNPVRAGMNIEHEGDKGSLQSSTQSLEHVETGAG